VHEIGRSYSAKLAKGITHSLISHLPLSRKEELGRTRERKWRLEKVDKEVEASHPRPSSHQAQVIFTSINGHG
jgi:hypothetical protein